jgi:hypothetical protein
VTNWHALIVCALDVADRIHDRWESRRHLRPRLWFLLPSGWPLLVTGVFAAAFCVAAAAVALLGSVAFTAGYGGTGVLLMLWCVVSARAAAAVPAEPEWTGEDEVILGGDLSKAAWKQAGQGQRGGVR